MSLRLVRDSDHADAYEQLYDSLHRVIEQIIDKKLAALPSLGWRWMPAKEAGVVLGISAAAVGQRVRQGTLPGRLYGRRIYVDAEALASEIDRATTEQQSGPDPRQR